MKKEIWKPVPDYEDLYEASNWGNLRNSVYRNGGHLKHTILKPKVMHNGYLTFRVTRDKKQRFICAHRTVAKLFILNPYGKPHVNHMDGVRHNNHVSNLEWVTISENVKHAYDTGLRKLKRTQEFAKCHPESKSIGKDDFCKKCYDRERRQKNKKL